jgi:hypothetical protein
MSSITRYLLLVPALIVVGVGLRLMYFGFHNLLTAPSNFGIALIGLIAGIVCFVAGILSGVLLLSSRARV